MNYLLELNYSKIRFYSNMKKLLFFSNFFYTIQKIIKFQSDYNYKISVMYFYHSNHSNTKPKNQTNNLVNNYNFYNQNLVIF